MPVNSDDIRELDRALQGVFPGSQIRLIAAKSGERVSAVQADVDISAGSMRLRIEVLRVSGRARLLDAVELLRLEQGNGSDSVPVLASPYISAANQQLLRDMQMSFIDFAGNAWILAPGVHVDRRGFDNPRREERDQRDLFSDKASLVLRVLLNERAPVGVRRIAEIASSQDADIRLSPGYVSKIVAELERRGYAGRRGEKIVLRRSEELISDWIVAYRAHKRPSVRSYFLSSASAELLMPQLAEAFDAHGVEYVFCGQAGASLVDRYASFNAVDVYVKNIEGAHHALVGIEARPVERGGNIRVMLPHYRVSAFYDLQMRKGSMKAASNIQLYLDLYDYPLRGREQAEHLYERRLRPLLERDDEV